MKSRIIYYAAANSCSGYVTHFGEYIKTGQKIIVLKNASRLIKNMLFKDLEKQLNIAKLDYETIISTGYAREIGAVIVPETKLVVADETYFGKDVPEGAFIYDFAECCETKDKHFLNLNTATLEENDIYNAMTEHMKNAKEIHDKWEEIYIKNIDFDKLNRATDELISEIFSNVGGSIEAQNAKNVNRFFGTLLPSGGKNYIDELTADLKKRIFIKGRPGTGKSTMLKKIRTEANRRGFDTETYFCSFDTQSLDMVVIREIGICVFDSTAPHEMFPTRSGDSVFDVYEKAVAGGTDEKYAQELEEIQKRYNAEMHIAKQYLHSAHEAAARREIEFNSTLSQERLNNVIKESIEISK